MHVHPRPPKIDPRELKEQVGEKPTLKVKCSTNIGGIVVIYSKSGNSKTEVGRATITDKFGYVSIPLTQAIQSAATDIVSQETSLGEKAKTRTQPDGKSAEAVSSLESTPVFATLPDPYKKTVRAAIEAMPHLNEAQKEAAKREVTETEGKATDAVVKAKVDAIKTKASTLNAKMGELAAAVQGKETGTDYTKASADKKPAYYTAVQEAEALLKKDTGENQDKEAVETLLTKIQTAKTALDGEEKKAAEDALNKAKEEAKKVINDLKDLTPDEKKDFNDQVDQATTPEDVQKVVDAAKKRNTHKSGWSTGDALAGLGKMGHAITLGDLTPRPQIPRPSTDIEKEPDKEIPSSVPHKEGGKEDSNNTMEVASPAQESQAGKPKSLPKTGAEAEMISLGVCLLVGGLSVIFNPFKHDQK
ncbi:hypothetical protein [Aerococcus christensenii]|uniref:hypothetical protein n=1 Tax=Aerococcus christensenii TaxID=87541 RepID=UPI003F4322CB